MNSTLELLNSALNQSDNSALHSILQVCEDSKLFKKQECIGENVVTLINTLLNINQNYEKGLDILKVFLPQCKSDLFGRHLFHWLQECTRGLRTCSNSVTVYSVLRDLLIYSKDYPDVRKQTSLNIIPKIMEFCFKNSREISPKTKIPFLICLEEILTTYGKACGNWKSRIELFLLSHLETSADVVYMSARCFLNLISIPPSNSNVEDFKQQWYKRQVFIVSAQHNILDSLFNNINEIQGTHERYTVEYDKKYIPKVGENSPLRASQRLTAQFVSLSEFLSILLLGNFPVSKKVAPDAILSVICRCLAITCKTLEANISNDSIILSTQIPTLHRACIKVLESLIQCGRRNLLPHARLICKILNQTLKWTLNKDYEYGQEKPYRLLRVDAYRCFSTWLSISRLGSIIQEHMKDLTASIISDIHFEKPAILLNVSAKRLKGKAGKKERKKNQDLSSAVNKLPAVINPEANKDVCCAALDLIPAVLQSSSHAIGPKLHKQFQERLVSELLLIQATDEVGLDVPIPYADDACRLSLYTALLALCNHHHSEFPAPCNYALPIFTEGMNDQSLLVAKFCSQAVCNVEKMVHPIGPTLSVPLVLNNEIASSINTTDHETIRQEIGTDTSRSIDNNESIILESVANLFDSVMETEIDNTNIQFQERVTHGVRKEQTEQNVANNSISMEEDIDTVVERPKEINIETENIAIRLEENVKIVSQENGVSKLEKRVHSKIVEDKKEIEESVQQPGKKLKKDSTEILNDNSLENEMLSSFVDIVG